jgi:hypothetical protein
MQRPGHIRTVAQIVLRTPRSCLSGAFSLPTRHYRRAA